jgi:hypothetical protein
MLHELKGVIHLAGSSDEGVRSDVEKIVQWNKKLCETKTLQTAVTSRRFDLMILELQRKIISGVEVSGSLGYALGLQTDQTPPIRASKRNKVGKNKT